MDIMSYALAKSEAKDYTDTVIAALPKGVIYKGAVDYQTSLPATGNEAGDCYTIKYKGSSGTEDWGAEFVWGTYEGTAQWIKLGENLIGVPSFTASDNGKILGVVNGELTWVTIPAAAGNDY